MAIRFFNEKSSRSISRVPFSASKCKVSVIYLHSLSPVSSSGLPSDVGRATLLNAGLHDLTTPKMHSPHITTRLVGSYPAFSPLQSTGDCGCFLLHYSAFADSFPLGSRMLCVARTFLLYILYQRQTDRLLFCGQSYRIILKFRHISDKYIRRSPVSN